MTNQGRPQPPGKYEIVVADGETYKLSHITPGLRLEFATTAEAEAWKRIERRRGNPAIYLELKKQLQDDILAGSYDWGSPDEGGMGKAIFRAVQDGTGPATMARLLMREHMGDIPVEKFAKAWEDNAEEFSKAVWRCLDPNSDSPPPPEEKPATGEKTKTNPWAKDEASPTPTSSQS